MPHELRHTAASLTITAGASIKGVQEMLGHASATLTVDRYGHLFDDDWTPSRSGWSCIVRTFCGLDD